MITIPNMIGAVASFELDVMSSSSEGYVYCSSKHAKYGERALLMTGASGKRGASGFVLVFWDKEEAT